MSPVLFSSLLLGGSSLLGSALGFVFKRIPHKLHDIFLGYCAGMMLAAAILCLAVPASEAAGDGGMWQVAMGIAIGAVVISLLDKVTPHLHSLTGIEPEEHANNTSIDRILLFVIAITLHKLPEGLAAGIAIDAGNFANSNTLSLSLALHNVPEGMVVIAPLLVAGVKPWRAFMMAAMVAVSEIIGILCGYGLGSISQVLLPTMMGFATGAMLYVISDEMIPETHSHGYQKAATFALVAGFITLLLIE